MRYLIDGKLVLTPDGVTTPGLHTTEVILAPLPLRLLFYFVNNNNKLITREELFLHVWESHNLTPSGASLATQVSNIRKLFSDYGLPEEILTTIPRQGIILKAEIEEYNFEQVNSENVFVQTLMGYKWYVLFFIFAISCFATAWHYSKNTDRVLWLPIANIKGCSVKVINDNLSKTALDYYVKKAGDFISENNIQCTDDDLVLISLQHPDISGKKDVFESKQFYSFCRKMKDTYICHNNYYSAGKIK